MTHMLKNHQKSIRKSKFFTVIPFSNPMMKYLQTRHHYLSKTTVMPAQRSMGSEKSLFLVAP